MFSRYTDPWKVQESWEPFLVQLVGTFLRHSRQWVAVRRRRPRARAAIRKALGPLQTPPRVATGCAERSSCCCDGGFFIVVPQWLQRAESCGMKKVRAPKLPKGLDAKNLRAGQARAIILLCERETINLNQNIIVHIFMCNYGPLTPKSSGRFIGVEAKNLPFHVTIGRTWPFSCRSFPSSSFTSLSSSSSLQHRPQSEGPHPKRS